MSRIGPQRSPPFLNHPPGPGHRMSLVQVREGRDEQEPCRHLHAVHHHAARTSPRGASALRCYGASTRRRIVALLATLSLIIGAYPRPFTRTVEPLSTPVALRRHHRRPSSLLIQVLCLPLGGFPYAPPCDLASLQIASNIIQESQQNHHQEHRAKQSGLKCSGLPAARAPCASCACTRLGLLLEPP